MHIGSGGDLFKIKIKMVDQEKQNIENECSESDEKFHAGIHAKCLW